MYSKYLALGFLLILLAAAGDVWCEDIASIPNELLAANSELYVSVVNGILKGKDNDFFYSYESVPYAESPIGKLRFEAPQNYRQIWRSTYNAAVPPQPCMQWNEFNGGEDLLTGVEDCLKLNIYKPKNGKPKGRKYPVMVFLHGGCFMHGNINGYRPDFLMETGQIIVVNVVYRLGPLGFLSTEDEAITGNFGLKDQQMALKWIQQNIAAFDGDPKKVMLTGFSAGGAATHLHALHPEAKTLMKTAVAFSGMALNPWVILLNARRDALRLAQIVGCDNSQTTWKIKSCLQTKNAEEIVRTVKDFLNYDYNPFTSFGPVVEHKRARNAFLTQHPRDIMKEGKINKITLIAGYTAEDGAYNAAALLKINPKSKKEFIYDLNDNWLKYAPINLFLRNIKDNPVEYAIELKKEYLGNKNLSVDNYLDVQKIYTDVDFKNGIMESIGLLGKYGRTAIYGYVYDNPAVWSLGYRVSNRSDIKFGTSHFDDISLIYKYPIRGPWRPDEEVISKKFINMLIKFVETEKAEFGSCKLENNVGKDQVNILRIKRDSC